MTEFSNNQMEYIFSAEEYRKRRGNEILQNKRSVPEVVSLYYKDNTELITKIIKDVENLRFNDPNRPDFSIKEFLDIDYVKLGIIEGLLDPNDYNMYISNNYLEVNDATFIKSFNLYDERPDLFTLKLYDFKTILSKMKLSKIVDSNGLNVYMIQWLHNSENRTDKGSALKNNAVNQPAFLKTFLEYMFEEYINKISFIKANISQVNNQSSLRVIINWIDTNLSKIDDKDITDIFNVISIKNDFSLLEEEYAEEIYFKLISYNIADLSTDSILIFILEKVKHGYHKLLNVTIDKYSESFFKNDFKNNEWLNYFNDNISSYISLLDSESIELVKKIYDKVGTVKIDNLSDITNPDFLGFIYEKNYYSYSDKNISFIRRKFEEGYTNNYEPYVAYSINNADQLFEFMKSSYLSLDLNNTWDNEYLVRLLNGAEIETFKSYLERIEEYSSIAFPSLELLDLIFEKIVIIANYVDLYENTLKNLLYIYDVLAQNDDSKIKLIDSILEKEEFDFDLLYVDVNEIETNKNLAPFVHNGILKNTGISMPQFEKYVEATDDNFENVKLASSNEKLKVLYSYNKAPYTYEILNEYDTEMLTFLFEEKEEHILQTLARLQADEVVHLLLKFDNSSVELKYLGTLLQNEPVDTTMLQAVIVSYLRAVDERYSLNELENTFLSLLGEIKTEDKNIKKLIELLSNKKGQRTISNDLLKFVEFLDEKGVTKHTLQQEDKIRVDYLSKE
ncbi:hypothetical protein [Enterococcus lactis]|uniref:hypothetical protein n=1 Tax=Enterococcus lactis TaxID=357441 RepID=UPI00237A9C4D|nr:hypothetical protein [Enterococcus lactis]